MKTQQLSIRQPSLTQGLEEGSFKRQMSQANVRLSLNSQDPKKNVKDNLRTRLIMDICEDDQEMHKKLIQRFQNEKKKHEDKLVTQRLQTKIQMRSLFSCKNLSALTSGIAPSAMQQFRIPRRQNSDLSVLNSEFEGNVRKQSHDDLEIFTQIQNNKQNVAAKIMNQQSLIITEQFETMSMNFGRSKEIDIGVECLDPSSKQTTNDIGEVSNLDFGEQLKIIQNAQPKTTPPATEKNPMSQKDLADRKRKLEVQKLKLSSGDKIRLHKRSETIRSMKFIRKLGKKLRQELEEQKEAILKFKKIQQKKLKNQKKNQRNNSMKQIGFANNLNMIKNKSHQLSSNNLIEKQGKIFAQKSMVLPQKIEKQKTQYDDNLDMLDIVNKNLSEISLSHSSSRVSTNTFNQQENLSKKVSSKIGSSVGYFKRSKHTTPRIEPELSIENRSSSQNQIQQINLFKGASQTPSHPQQDETNPFSLPPEEEEFEYYAEDTSQDEYKDFQEFSDDKSSEKQQLHNQPSRQIIGLKRKSSQDQPSKNPYVCIPSNPNIEFYSLKLNKFRLCGSTPESVERNSQKSIQETSTPTEIYGDDAYFNYMQQQQMQYLNIKMKQNQTLSSISEEASDQKSSSIYQGEQSIQSMNRLQHKLSTMKIIVEEKQKNGSQNQGVQLQNDHKLKRNLTTDHILGDKKSKFCQEFSDDTPTSMSSSQNFIIEEASEHTINSQYSGKPMSQVIMCKLSASRVPSSRQESPTMLMAMSMTMEQKDMGVQASPMTSLGESSELADSYDEEAAMMFQQHEQQPEIEQEELESDSTQKSVSSEQSKDSNEILQSSSQDQSESLSSNENSEKTKPRLEKYKAAVISSNNKNKQEELKIIFSPMMTRNDIENVDDLSDLEEFYLTEIEQQQNHDLIEKLNCQGQLIQDEIRMQQMKLKQQAKLDQIKEEADKLLNLKVKLQRHETKKQIFSFNMYKVRKISDHDLFKDEDEGEQTAQKRKQFMKLNSTVNFVNSASKVNRESKCKVPLQTQGSFAKLTLMRQANSTVNVVLKAQFDGQRSTKDLGSKSRGSSGSLWQFQKFHQQNQRKTSFKEKTEAIKDYEGPNQLSISSPSQSLSSDEITLDKQDRKKIQQALTSLKISGKDSRTNVIEDHIKRVPYVIGKPDHRFQKDFKSEEIAKDVRYLKHHRTRSFSYDESSQVKSMLPHGLSQKSSINIDDNSEDIQPSIKMIVNTNLMSNQSISDDQQIGSATCKKSTPLNSSLIRQMVANLNTNSEEVSPHIMDNNNNNSDFMQKFRLEKLTGIETISENSQSSQQPNSGSVNIDSGDASKKTNLYQFAIVPISHQSIIPNKKDSIFQTQSSTVGRRGHQLIKQRKQSSTKGENSNVNQSRNRNVQSIMQSGFQTSGQQSSLSSIHAPRLPLAAASDLEYSHTQTLTDSLLFKKTQPSPNDHILQNFPTLAFKIQELPRDESQSLFTKNDAMARLQTIESQKKINKNKEDGIKIFSPKNAQVSREKALRQVRNNLKELLNDVEIRSKSGILSPPQEQSQSQTSTSVNKKEIRTKSHTEQIFRSRQTSIEQCNNTLLQELKLSDRSKKKSPNNRVTFGPISKTNSEKKPPLQISVKNSKSRNPGTQHFNTTNNSVFLLSPKSSNGFQIHHQRNQKSMFLSPPNSQMNMSQIQFNSRNSQVSELHQNFMIYNTSTESLQQIKTKQSHKRSNTSNFKKNNTQSFQTNNYVNSPEQKFNSIQIALPPYQSYVPKTRIPSKMYPQYQGY